MQAMTDENRKGSTKRIAALAVVCLAVASIAFATAAEAQQTSRKQRDAAAEERSRNLLPAPGVNIRGRQSEEKVFDAERGTVFRYEFQPNDGPATLYRDMYELPGYGTRGSAGIRFKF